MRFGSSLGIIALILTLATGARAEKVDWSDFIEKPSDRKPLRQATPVVAEPAPKPTKAVKAKPARVARSKAKVAAKPRTKVLPRRKK